MQPTTIRSDPHVQRFCPVNSQCHPVLPTYERLREHVTRPMRQEPQSITAHADGVLAAAAQAAQDIRRRILGKT